MSKYYKLDKIKEISGGDDSFVKEMVELFLKDVDSNMKSFNDMLEQNDMDGIAKLAHKIKPSIDLLGIEIIQEDIRELRTEAENQSMKVSELITKLNDGLLKAAEELRKDL